MTDTPTNEELGQLGEECDTEAYREFRKMGGDHIGAEQYSCAIFMRNQAQTIIKDTFSKIGDIVDDKDGRIHVARIAERVFAQSTNTARALRESLYAEPDDTGENKDDWE